MDVNTHLDFAGNCREAFDAYASLLGGTIDFAMTWGESPMAADRGPQQRDQIMPMSAASAFPGSVSTEGQAARRAGSTR